MLEVEILEPRLPHLPHPGTGQHAEANDPGGAVVLCRIQRRRHARDFLMRKISLARRFHPAAKPCRGVVFAPSPFDGISEHLANDLADTVGADRCGLGALELAGPVVGLLL